jgi:NDP-sugar pyrophosphorylase family protein
MSTAFVILAGGRGTRVSRVGGELHKSLLPLNGRAVISHLIDLAPTNARIIISLGDRAGQIRDYLALAHPTLDSAIEFALTRDWDKPGAGPGSGLLACRELVGDDNMIFTSCDTLWEPNLTLWSHNEESWVGVAPVPAGTEDERWCRVEHSSELIAMNVYDKRSGGRFERSPAYVGLAHIASRDLQTFWGGVTGAKKRAGELQVSGGFDAIIQKGASPLWVRRIHDWTDVGDEVGYRNAVARVSGYDWTKLGQATYVLEDEMRVVKYHESTDVISRRYERAQRLGSNVPQTLTQRGNMIAYPYVPGDTAYAAAYDFGVTVTQQLLDWYREGIWKLREKVEPGYAEKAALSFYRWKTSERIWILPTDLRNQATAAVKHIDWDGLADGVISGHFHGDLNHGNVIAYKMYDDYFRFTGIDWREDFAGEQWGDIRYDLAKLLAGTVIDWDAARRGDFRPWEDGPVHADVIRRWIDEHVPEQTKSIEIIGALSLINCAPLHASPLDEICVARAAAWLSEVI